MSPQPTVGEVPAGAPSLDPWPREPGMALRPVAVALALVWLAATLGSWTLVPLAARAVADLEIHHGLHRGTGSAP